MSDVHPPAPYTSEIDLKNFAYTPIFRARLFSSTFHAKASDAEWRAGMTLWLKSWDQHPAGSLPNDHHELCRLAELGRDIKRWHKIAPMALLHWELAEDGRLYHHVVTEIVTDAWERKISQRNRTSNAREARLLQRERRLQQKEDRLALLQQPLQDELQSQSQPQLLDPIERRRRERTETNRVSVQFGKISKDISPHQARGRARGGGEGFDKSPRLVQAEAFAHAANEPSRNRPNGRSPADPLPDEGGNRRRPTRHRS